MKVYARGWLNHYGIASMKNDIEDIRTRSPRKEVDIPIAPSLYSLSNKMDNSLLAVRGINHKYIVVERR